MPITVGTSFYEAMLLYKGKRVIASLGDEYRGLHVGKLMVYCTCGLVAGVIGGLLGLGGGFILGPLFIGLGIPPQVYVSSSSSSSSSSHLLPHGIHSHSPPLSTKLGLKCYIHFCNDVFCIHVRGGILPSQTFPCSLW